MKKSLLFSLTILLITILSCSSDEIIKPGDSIDVAFEKSLRLYNNEEYVKATEAFETVLNISRGTQFAKDAQFYLAQSYFKSKQYLLAASEYNRFILYYPRDEKRQEAQYNEALSYYQLSPRYKLDQKQSEKSLELFQLFVLRYPISDQSIEAGKKIDELRNKLAHKKFDAAEFYLNINEYLAAAMYYGQTVDKYPESDWAEPSLFKQIEAYYLYAENSVANKQQERYQLALNSYQKYLQLFPNGGNRTAVEDLADKLRDKLENLALGR